VNKNKSNDYNDSEIASSYESIGLAMQNLGKYEEALI
jgi:hypothetical protein